MSFKTGCLICGNELVYSDQTFENKCFYCGNVFNSNEKCKNDHFVCNTCHSSSAFDLIENYTISTEILDPSEIAINLMKNPVIKMHGPEHHFLVPAVLLSSYYNTVGEKGKKSSAIKTARKRAEKVPGGFCGFNGACGAGIGSGIFVSVLTGATPVTKENWGQSNLATAKGLEAIASCGGPRCCKRDTFLVLKSTKEFVKNNFDVEINLNENIKCDFSDLNKECLKEECSYYYS